MGFISFSLKYYAQALQGFESGAATPEKIYLARQFVKMLDDLLDEGYTKLGEKLEEAFWGVSRLHKYLRENNTEPFINPSKVFSKSNVTYTQEESELEEAIEFIMNVSKDSGIKSDNPFLFELMRFCDWIGYEKILRIFFYSGIPCCPISITIQKPEMLYIPGFWAERPRKN